MKLGNLVNECAWGPRSSRHHLIHEDQRSSSTGRLMNDAPDDELKGNAEAMIEPELARIPGTSLTSRLSHRVQR